MKNICISVVESLDLAKPQVCWIGALPPRCFQDKKDIVNHGHISGCVHNGRYKDNCIAVCLRCAPGTITISYTAESPGSSPSVIPLTHMLGGDDTCSVLLLYVYVSSVGKQSKYKPVTFGLGM